MLLSVTHRPVMQLSWALEWVGVDYWRVGVAVKFKNRSKSLKKKKKRGDVDTFVNWMCSLKMLWVIILDIFYRVFNGINYYDKQLSTYTMKQLNAYCTDRPTNILPEINNILIIKHSSVIIFHHHSYKFFAGSSTAALRYYCCARN